MIKGHLFLKSVVMSLQKALSLLLVFFQKSKAFQEKCLESLTQVKNFKAFSLNAIMFKKSKKHMKNSLLP